MIIYQYINKLTKENIIQFGLKQNVTLNDDEVDIIYDYIKNDNKQIINNPLEIILEVKDKVSEQVYHKILELYDKYKDFLDKLK